jgi:hypothetical protein
MQNGYASVENLLEAPPLLADLVSYGFNHYERNKLTLVFSKEQAKRESLEKSKIESFKDVPLAAQLLVRFRPFFFSFTSVFIVLEIH